MKTKCAFLVAAAVVMMTGCRNFMYEKTVEIEQAREEGKDAYINCIIKPAPESSSSFTVTLEKHERAVVHKFKYRNKDMYYTRYVWWRKFYQIPAGIGLIPVSMFAHLASAFSLGMFPFEAAQYVNDLAFTGINPFMSWELSADDIAEEEKEIKNRTLLAKDRRLIVEPKDDPTPEDMGTSVQNRVIPIANQEILLVSGEKTKSYKTDKFGSFTVHYIHPSSSAENFIPQKRKFVITIPGNKNASEPVKGNSVILRRDFMQNLNIARSKIASYQAGATPKGLYDTVILLEKMGFIDLAYILEEIELEKHKNDPNFINEFNNLTD